MVDVLSPLIGLMEENGMDSHGHCRCGMERDTLGHIIRVGCRECRHIRSDRCNQGDWNDYGDGTTSGVEALWDFVAGILEGAAAVLSRASFIS
ncbi:MAG: hypothetical protein V8Q42_09110 [Anaerovoracaceae bacterium]